MKFYAKIRWVASILLVFFIVLITNLIDRANFNRLSYSVTTMYEDRIVASDILFELSGIIKEKHIAVLTSNAGFFNSENDKYNKKVDQLIDRYRITKLTEEEMVVFNQLQQELISLKKKEKASKALPDNDIIKSIESVDQYLYKLSKIQLQEAKQQVFISNRVKETINLYTQGEIIFLIVMAVLVQIIILYKPKD